ncbi:MAG: galactose-1-phosphate uridylyltransferase, partial [Candidatus Sumerlaeia bacterium]|nr:galactose-1-phosphate uridylyltransferase [Candidatus Sumerlaeia bacterium]
MADFFENPHKRYNPLKDEWVLVSPHRLKRPWQGKVEDAILDDRPDYDPKCYLCPGNERANGERNPQYEGTYVFDNDFSALLIDADPGEINEEDLLVARAERGHCRVVCFTPRHDLTLAGMTQKQIRAVVDTWADEYTNLGARPEIGYVQIFENKGQIMGCSNPHPHGQIWATESLPVEVEKVDQSLRKWEAEKGEGLLVQYARLERKKQERIVCDNGDWIAVVPFWAKWPYEIMIQPVDKIPHIAALDDRGRDALADILRRVAVRYDNLFRCPF